jgi:hypothetical protein
MNLAKVFGNPPVDGKEQASKPKIEDPKARQTLE